MYYFLNCTNPFKWNITAKQYGNFIRNKRIADGDIGIKKLEIFKVASALIGIYDKKVNDTRDLNKYITYFSLHHKCECVKPQTIAM